MNDTHTNLSLLKIFNKDSLLSSSEVSALKTDLSLVTVKRQLSNLFKADYLEKSGAGRSVKYSLSKKGLLLGSIEADQYLKISPDERVTDSHFNFDIFSSPNIELFNESELERLNEATINFRERSKLADLNAHKKELMRFIIEFSWKTSQIEGNTYDLIATERLLLYGEKSPTNTDFETQMILNQKIALEFILDNIEIWRNPSQPLLEKLHSCVADGLNISKGFRKSLVGIIGTNYRPLENEHQIKEAVNQLLLYLMSTNNTYEKAMIAVLGLSYIQPFIDGNKRTARLFGNSLLISNNMAPLSYRSVNDRKYKEATLIFYEQNNVIPFKELFIEQYVFSANNYSLGSFES